MKESVFQRTPAMGPTEGDGLCACVGGAMEPTDGRRPSRVLGACLVRVSAASAPGMSWCVGGASNGSQRGRRPLRVLGACLVRVSAASAPGMSWGDGTQRGRRPLRVLGACLVRVSAASAPGMSWCVGGPAMGPNVAGVLCGCLEHAWSECPRPAHPACLGAWGDFAA